MKLVAISDTHNRHKHLTSVAMGSRLSDGDLLIHAGDFSAQGLKHEVQDVLKWLVQQAPRYTHGIVFIAGNHDRSFDGPKFGDDDIEEGSRKKPLWLQEALDNLPSNVRYLENNSVTIEGIKIWGSPVTPWFHGDRWAFNKHRGEDIDEVWNKIPMDTDIIVTHGPVAYKLDYVSHDGHYAGCEHLRQRVQSIKPILHISGHIHECHGYDYDEHTHYFNASICSHQYEPVNRPWEIEIDLENKVIGDFIS
jgi:Icc-related predicted phosphoesterase